MICFRTAQQKQDTETPVDELEMRLQRQVCAESILLLPLNLCNVYCANNFGGICY